MKAGRRDPLRPPAMAFLRQLLLAGLPAAAATVFAASTAAPIVGADLVFEERDGLVAVEAEHFFRQELTSRRAWHLYHAGQRPAIAPDTDGTHVTGASGGAYLEVLPDSRWSHGEKLVDGENFSREPGRMAVLSYRVHFNTPGRYHFWARVFSTGSEDNGFHVGLDGSWPESGQRWQTIKKRAWQWDSRQRTPEVHVGVPGQLFLDVATPGERVIQISMREDGIEIDKWLMTTDRSYTPQDTGPPPRVRVGRIPAPFAVPIGYVETAAPTPVPQPPPAKASQPAAPGVGVPPRPPQSRE